MRGTVMVKDTDPHSTPHMYTAPSQLTNVNGTLFFDAIDADRTVELWKSDGTAAGTTLVKDINPFGSSQPTALTNVNGTLFFNADDGVHGRELWKSDGTAVGTVLVKDINPSGPLDPFRGNSPLNLTNVNGRLFLEAFDLVHGYELWKSDGTPAGTVLVKDLLPGPESSTPLLDYFSVRATVASVSGNFFFSADDGVHGAELWKSDGTAAGTVLVRDINRGNKNSIPDQLTNVNGTLFFSADDGRHAVELWKSDGSAGGTVFVRDINRSGTSQPAELTAARGRLFFSAFDHHHGRELWVTSPRVR